MLLEICANSYQSAKNAQDAGAHRIELCQQLSVGGITPSFGLLEHVLNHLRIKTFVLIRPRSGNFVYSNEEFEIMKTNIQLCKDLGAKGIVSGILNSDKTIDIHRTQELIKLSKPLSFTFHRAFDETINPQHALEQLADLGVSRILTSGQKPTAIEGIELLKQLHKISKGRLLILPGSGVDSSNVIQFKNAGFHEIHASASIKLPTDNSMFSQPQTVSSTDKIKAILNAI